MKNTSVGGSLYSCIAAWRPRNTGKGSLLPGLDHLSHDKWICHLSSSDWSRALELVMRLLRLRLTFELRAVQFGVIVNPCRTWEYYVDLGMQPIGLPKHLRLLLCSLCFDPVLSELNS